MSGEWKREERDRSMKWKISRKFESKLDGGHWWKIVRGAKWKYELEEILIGIQTNNN